MSLNNLFANKFLAKMLKKIGLAFLINTTWILLQLFRTSINGSGLQEDKAVWGKYA